MNTPDQPTVAAVLINYRRVEDTVECVHTLERCGYPSLKIVIVENGSQDGSEEALRSRCKGHEVVQTGTNLGFASGNNAGIRHAERWDPKYILILNNDTLVPPGFLSPLVEALEHSPQAAAATGTIYYHDNDSRIWYGGGRIAAWRASALTEHLNERRRPEELGATRAVTFISGCLMLIRKSVLDAIGGFDERYFIYVEDVELCSRILNSGYQLLYVPRSFISHKAEKEDLRPHALYYMFRNRLLFLNEWKHPLGRWVGKAYLYSSIGLKLIMWSFGHPDRNRAAIAAITDYHRGRFFQARGLSQR